MFINSFFLWRQPERVTVEDLVNFIKMTPSLSYAVRNLFLIVVVALGVVLTIHLLGWATSGLTHQYQYQDYDGYQVPGYYGYQAPGEKSYMSHMRNNPQHLLSLLSPEALTGLLDRIKAEGPAMRRIGTGETGDSHTLNISHSSDTLEEISHLLGNGSFSDCLSQSLCYYDSYRGKHLGLTGRLDNTIDRPIK